MSAMKFQVPRGTFDVLPELAQTRQHILQVVGRTLARAGYGQIETPIFEQTDLFARGVGESTDIVQKEMYTFTDAGGRSLTLRPEGTASVCRAYIQHGMHKLPAPTKLWYVGPFFRYERAQAGRYRQFSQFGAEVLGSEDPTVDAELIVLMATIFEELELGNVRLRLGTLGSPETRLRYRSTLQKYLHANEGALSPQVRERIALNPLRAFDASDPATQTVMKEAPTLLSELDDHDADHFQTVRAMLDSVGVDYQVDPTLVRGLDYYTQTVFEFCCDDLGAQSGVGGGGRYDGLIEQLGGAQAGAAGWAVGLERLTLALAKTAHTPHEISPELYIAAISSARKQEAFELTFQARQAGICTQLELGGRSRKGVFKHADRLQTQKLAVLDGATGEPMLLRDMESREEQTVPANEVIATLLRARRGL